MAVPVRRTGGLVQRQAMRYAWAMFMTHLECSLTGERYRSDRLQNLSKAGKPLLARYDLEAVAARLSRDELASRPPGMWKWRELLPLPKGAAPVSLGEPETPLIPLDRVGAHHGARAPIVKDEGRLPTGSFKARGRRPRSAWLHTSEWSGSPSRPTAMPARRWPPMPRGPGSAR